ncbi:hypothetical protein [Massilia niabensis]|uniref:Uncharacterized protein n=1 Tax=Massilia niabensis TaxID=544910 RepID=A0ABW0L416_9BURK
MDDSSFAWSCPGKKLNLLLVYLHGEASKDDTVLAPTGSNNVSAAFESAIPEWRAEGIGSPGAGVVNRIKAGYRLSLPAFYFGLISCVVWIRNTTGTKNPKAAGFRLALPGSGPGWNRLAV